VAARQEDGVDVIVAARTTLLLSGRPGRVGVEWRKGEEELAGSVVGCVGAVL
jgi:hypothetical protein